jgi:phosphoglycolate phosphatase-like HAD superfamily hydrolase
MTYKQNKLRIDADGHLSALDGGFARFRREPMTDSMTDPDAYTDEELKQALARVLALARSEALNDAEVQRFWQLYEEILRRRAPPGTAA